MFRILRQYSQSASPVDLQRILREDLKTAMRNKAPMAQRTTIRTLLSELKNLDIDNSGHADKFAVWQHLHKLGGERSKTAAEYLKPGQPERFQELAAVELAEGKLIAHYLLQLPVASKEEIKSKVLELVQEKGLDLSNKQGVFKSIPWNKVQEEWNASRSMISEVINNDL